MKKQLSIEKALSAAVSKTFADMAFVDTLFVENGEKENLTFSQVIRIKIFSPRRGEIVLYLPKFCKKLIVENIYGDDWKTLHPTEIDDCLLEILNVLAGNFLTNYFGDSKKHDISLPEILFDKEELSSDKFYDFTFTADDNLFRISINI